MLCKEVFSESLYAGHQKDGLASEKEWILTNAVVAEYHLRKILALTSTSPYTVERKAVTEEQL